MAKEQDSYVLFAEALLFESQLLLLELEVEEAKLLLNDAQRIAEEKEIYRLAILISKAHDYILENLDSWENASSLLPDIADRLELTHIEHLLQQLLQSRIIYSNIENENEQPCAFLILGENNILIFSLSLSDSFSVSQFNNSLLHKIQNAVIEYKCKIPVFERIRYNGHTILIDRCYSLLFCYIFIGNSYSAKKHLNNLIDNIQNKSGIWGKLLPRIKVGQQLTIEDRIKFSDFIQNALKK